MEAVLSLVKSNPSIKWSMICEGCRAAGTTIHFIYFYICIYTHPICLPYCVKVALQCKIAMNPQMSICGDSDKGKAWERKGSWKWGFRVCSGTYSKNKEPAARAKQHSVPGPRQWDKGSTRQEVRELQGPCS